MIRAKYKYTDGHCPFSPPNEKIPLLLRLLPLWRGRLIQRSSYLLCRAKAKEAENTVGSFVLERIHSYFTEKKNGFGKEDEQGKERGKKSHPGMGFRKRVLEVWKKWDWRHSSHALLCKLECV